MKFRALSIAVSTIALVCAPAMSQDEAEEAPQFWSEDGDGNITHDPSGAVCPASLGDATLYDILSFDGQPSGRHFGITCLYFSEAIGSQANIVIVRADQPDLAGEGSPATTWNQAMRRTMAQYPNALPVTLEGLGDDPSSNLFGSVIEANRANGIPVYVGLWFADGSEWVVRGDATFAGVEQGVEMATQLRQSILNGYNAAN